MGRSWILSTMLAATLLTPAAAQAATVTIELGPGNTLNPSGSVTINANDTIAWRWVEDKNHHIASIAGQVESWDSGERSLGPDFQRVFPQSGAFKYVCNLHPVDMKGTITVTDAPPPPPVNVAAPPPPPEPSPTAPAEQAQPAPTGPPPALTQPVAVPSALASIAAPTASAARGQRIKRQRAVKLVVVCPAACELTLTGTVKVGSKRLRLTKLSRSLGADQSATLTLKVDARDLVALRRARGKASAAIKVTAVAGGKTTATSIAVGLMS